MSALIPGMEMPKEGTVIAIYKLNGQFYASVHGTELSPIIPVPEHGRCIDADEIHYTGEYGGTRVTTKSLIDCMPAIIPADPAEEGK